MLALLLAASGCGRAGGALDATASAARPLGTSPELDPADQTAPTGPDAESMGDDLATDSDAAAGDLIGRLERLRKRGAFEEFIDATLNATGEPGAGAALDLLKTEALLAVGRNYEAEIAASQAGALALESDDAAASAHALKLWTTARFRQQKSLDDPFFDKLLATLPADDPVAQTLGFWRDTLGSQSAFGLTSPPGRVELRAASAAAGTVPAELNGIEARVNGVSIPLAFVDTGTQHTLLTVAAAEAAGVAFGSRATGLVGFARLHVRPGVIKMLELGSLTLRDVPVLVGDSAPLVAVAGQMALGTELMHHVRFTLDYPGRRVFAEPAATRQAWAGKRPATWDIPLWTFSQACLARGQTPKGAMARVLVDTGNRAGAYVSPRWAHRNLPSFPRSAGPIVFKYKSRHLMIDALELGDRSLRDWPVLDTIPAELERLDTVDVLLGRDLLWPFRVTIDLAQRMLQLEGDGPRSAARPAQNAPEQQAAVRGGG